MEKKLQIDTLKEEIETKLNNVKTLCELNDLKVLYLGKKGPINELTSLLREMTNEDRKTFGMLLNTFKEDVNLKFETIKLKLEEINLNLKLDQEQIDVTLPGTKVAKGGTHPLTKVVEEIEELFISMGYDVVEGPEVELDLYNFEMLNLPKGHPARDTQDTFYINEEVLLRTQTSAVQVRTMLENKDKTPIRIICPGKTYRRDNDDATHSHQFTQIEGLLVDKKVSLADLKGTLDLFAKKMFGDDRKTRFRPSYYPFTEPSVEFDVSCHKCNGDGCNVCKETGWVTIMGAGIVHPKVLKDAGYDPNVFTGFAFGMGAERIAMLKYGINDIRSFYINDYRTLLQFNRIGGEL